MSFVINPDTKIVLGIPESICNYFLSRKSGVFDWSENPQSRKVPGRKSMVSRKISRKPFSGFSVSFSQLDLTRDSSQSKRDPNHGISKLKIEKVFPRKLPGRVSGSKIENK